mmetsp:Transcript_14927/g.22457  ORF Transcript_14927/g.22457 Transcript_14927/m.22457 type:complete len:200 (-) Transcript_14927:110-709(-)
MLCTQCGLVCYGSVKCHPDNIYLSVISPPSGPPFLQTTSFAASTSTTIYLNPRISGGQLLSGRSASPFPLLDDEVILVATRESERSGGTKLVRVSQWSLTAYERQKQNDLQLPPLYILTYQISGSKFCGNIGRHHKSNGIMFEANINNGYLVQKCWDPNCRGYSSPPIPVAVDIMPTIIEVQEEVADRLIASGKLDSMD